MKYKDWLEEWLALYVKPAVKIQTFEKYSQFVRLHISPMLGASKIENLNAVKLQKFVIGLSEKGLSPNTVNAIVTVLQSSLRKAVGVGIAKNQYSDKIQRPKTKEHAAECFSVAEQKQIELFAFEGKKPKLYGIVLCLYTGLRIGELLALEWSDIDFEQGVLTVAKSCHDRKQGRVTEEPKTKSSQRRIPLPKQLLPMLKKWRKEAKTAYVVEDNGKPVIVRSYQKTFELVLKNLGIPHRSFHVLRHTFATRAMECGMDVRTLAELMGHKNPTVTLNRYAHSLFEHKTEMMNRVGSLL